MAALRALSCVSTVQRIEDVGALRRHYADSSTSLRQARRLFLECRKPASVQGLKRNTGVRLSLVGFSGEKTCNGATPCKELRLLSSAAAALPLLLAFVSAELPEGIEYIRTTSDFHISEAFIKTFYMVFVCVFSWGAVVFGSMNDQYYESDEYRSKGGNGTGFWLYERAEEEEESAREELWKEELRKEIEDKMSEVKELQDEKEKELV